MDPHAFKQLVVLLGFGLVAMATYLAFRSEDLKRKAQLRRMDPQLDARLERIEQAIQAVAVETERIAEGQRFTTKLLAESGQQPRTPESR